MDWRESIALDPSILAGKPVVKGTRLAVEFIINLPSQGDAPGNLEASSWPPRPGG